MAKAVITPTDGELRIWVDDGSEWGAPYQVGARIRWRPTEPGSIDLTLGVAASTVTRAAIRAAIVELMSHGIQKVYTTRHDGGLMPGGQVQPDGSVCVYLDLALSRLTREKSTGCDR